VGSRSLKLVLIAVWMFEGRPVSVRELGSVAGYGRAQTDRALAELLRLGVIKSAHAGVRSRRYEIRVSRLRRFQCAPEPIPDDLTVGTRMRMQRQDRD